MAGVYPDGRTGGWKPAAIFATDSTVALGRVTVCAQAQ
jgi:hypothetical protein